MKIGYLCGDVEIPLLGHEGCSIHIRQLTDALVEEGHDVFIVCATLGEGRDAPPRARVYHLGTERLGASAWQILRNDPVIVESRLDRDLESVLFNASLAAEARAIVERERPDFLYERYSLFGWGGTELARRSGIPLVLELNAPLCKEQAGYDRFVLTHAAAALETVVLRSADALVTVSEWLKGWAIEQGVDAGNVHVMRNGVNQALFAAKVDGDRVRDRYALRDKQVVGHVGTFQWFHDIDGLFRAFCRLYEDDPNVRLLLVGSGPERRKLEKAARARGVSEGIVVAGRVPHEKVPELIAAMDVAVVPYRATEEFFFSPMKLFECMAVGIPTVAAALGQITEVIDHQRTGWLYRAGDEDSLTESIRTLLHSPDVARRIGQAGRSEVLTRYTWRAIARRVVELGAGLIDSRRPAGGRSQART